MTYHQFVSVSLLLRHERWNTLNDYNFLWHIIASKKNHHFFSQKKFNISWIFFIQLYPLRDSIHNGFSIQRTSDHFQNQLKQATRKHLLYNKVRFISRPKHDFAQSKQNTNRYLSIFKVVNFHFALGNKTVMWSLKSSFDFFSKFDDQSIFIKQTVCMYLCPTFMRKLPYQFHQIMHRPQHQLREGF